MINEKSSKLENFTYGNRYRQQKKQVEQIVRRIDKKRSMQIFIQRSQGSLLQNEIKNRRKTEMKLQEQFKKTKKKLMQQKRNTISFNLPSQQIKSLKRHATQSPQKLSSIAQKQRKIAGLKNELNEAQIITVNISDQSKSYLLEHNKKTQQTFTKNNEHQFLPSSKKGGIRPILQQLQDYLQQRDPATLQLRRKIVQMLVLCLMRRCHRKLYQALDIALQTSSFFEQNDKQAILKSICLRLIGKIYKEISLQQKRKRISLEGGLKGRSTRKMTKRRHSSFMIKTLASQRVFYTRFAHKFKKSKLLKETTYKKEEAKWRADFDDFNGDKGWRDNVDSLQGSNSKLTIINSFNEFGAGNNNNDPQKNQHQGPIITKLTSKLAISLPSPSTLLQRYSPSTQPHSPSAPSQPLSPSISSSPAHPYQNYNIIIHQRDIQSTNKLFPYQYPSSIQKLMSKRQYTFLISAVNSVIFSQTQCYGFFEVLKKFVMRVMVMLITLLSMMIYLHHFDSTSILDWTIIILLMMLLILLSLTFIIQHHPNRIHTLTGQQSHQRVTKQLDKWNSKYRSQTMIFKTTENCEALIICWPNDQPGGLESRSSVDYADSINESSLSSSSVRGEELLEDGDDDDCEGKSIDLGQGQGEDSAKRRRGSVKGGELLGLLEDQMEDQNEEEKEDQKEEEDGEFHMQVDGGSDSSEIDQVEVQQEEDEKEDDEEDEQEENEDEEQEEKKEHEDQQENNEDEMPVVPEYGFQLVERKYQCTYFCKTNGTKDNYDGKQVIQASSDRMDKGREQEKGRGQVKRDRQWKEIRDVIIVGEEESVDSQIEDDPSSGLNAAIIPVHQLLSTPSNLTLPFPQQTLPYVPQPYNFSYLSSQSINQPNQQENHTNQSSTNVALLQQANQVGGEWCQQYRQESYQVRRQLFDKQYLCDLVGEEDFDEEDGVVMDEGDDGGEEGKEGEQRQGKREE